MPRLRLLSALVSLMLVSCAAPPAPEPGAGELAQSDLQRLTSRAPAPMLAATVSGLNDVTLSLHRRLVKPDENLVTASVSITAALGMTSAGASGETLDAFRSALRIAVPQADFHLAMNTVDRDLGTRGQGARGTQNKPFALKRVNQLFAQQGFGLEQSFLDLLAQQYGAGVRLLDFAAQPEASREGINRFVELQTETLIKDLLPSGSIKPETRVVLANAVYFNAKWAHTFDKARTSPGPFTLLDGARVQVDLMRDAEHPARGATVNGVEVIELPYEQDEVSLVLLVPPAGGLAALEASLTPTQLQQFVSSARSEVLDLSMPKFELRTASRLKDPLIAEGLGVAFSDGADFSAMSSASGLQISDMLHQAVINVAEEGTEAAGATAVVIGTDSVPQTRTVAVDRPFVFVLRDRPTGLILFLGRVTDPR